MLSTSGSRLPRLGCLAVLLLLAGCATGTSAERMAPSSGFRGSAGAGTRLVIPVVASKGPLSTRIGWVYRIEGYLEGQPVEYVGSATDLKQRLTNQHRWSELLRQGSTKVYATEVLAELDVPASNRRTLMSARNEALRAAEQRVLEQVRQRVHDSNLRRATGEQETVVLNEINASTDAAAWEARHKVVTSGKWELFERHLMGGGAKVLVALTLLDAYLMYYQAKMSRYVMAPYVLEDEQGLFTLEKRGAPLSSRYFKVYRNGGATGSRTEVSSDEFKALKEEAEALWGTTDWAGDFVPGLLNRELPVVEHRGGL